MKAVVTEHRLSDNSPVFDVECRGSDGRVRVRFGAVDKKAAEDVATLLNGCTSWMEVVHAWRLS